MNETLEQQVIAALKAHGLTLAPAAWPPSA